MKRVRIVGIVLAAGESRRLGRPKQLVSYRGQPLLRALTSQVCASRCDGVAVVVGGGDAAIEECLEGLSVHVVANPDRDEGMASSIRRGVAWAEGEGCDGVMLLVCDQPALSTAHVDALIGAWQPGTRVVASRYGGALGVPALFARTMFGVLLALRGAKGARAVIRAEKDAVAVDWPEGVFDVDTPAHAARLPI